MLSNAQSRIEITPFSHDNIGYKHVKGSSNTDTDCFDNNGIVTSPELNNALSLDGDDLFDLLADKRYRIVDESIRTSFNSFLESDDIYLADGSTYSGVDLLECITTVWTNPRLDASHDCDDGVQFRPGFVRIPGIARFDWLSQTSLLPAPYVHMENTKAFVLAAGPGVPVGLDVPEAAYIENKPFLHVKRGPLGTRIAGFAVTYQGSTTLDIDVVDGDNVFGIFCSQVVPELTRITGVFVDDLAAAGPLNFLPLFDGTEGEWTLSERVAGAGSTTFVWTNTTSSREITYNTYEGVSQLWSISGSGDDRVATLIAATIQTSHQNALTWAINLIRVGTGG